MAAFLSMTGFAARNHASNLGSPMDSLRERELIVVDDSGTICRMRSTTAVVCGEAIRLPASFCTTGPDWSEGVT